MVTSIVGTSTVTKDIFLQLLSQNNPNVPTEVVDQYYAQEPLWGIRADVLISQMILETDYLKSWWSQPPQRNMAGIGVTGEVKNSDPQDPSFTFNPVTNKWQRGLTFPDWQAAVSCHFAHMSAYVYADERNNASQIDPRYKIAHSLYGAKTPSRTLDDLSGKWATGATYGSKIEQILERARIISNTHEPDSHPTQPPLDVPNITDLSMATPTSVYTPGRAPFTIQLLVLHDTVGGDNAPDRNDLGLSAASYKDRETGTIEWFQGGGTVSIHYLIGPEILEGDVYRLCPESGVARHAIGSLAKWTAPDGTVYSGYHTDQVGKVNHISIGIERWGAVNEPVGPNQRKAMLGLAVDIARRYNLSPEQIVSHKAIQTGKDDGGVLLQEVRQAVTDMRNGGNLNSEAASKPIDGFRVSFAIQNKLTQLGKVALTNEQVYTSVDPNANLPRSFTWAANPNGSDIVILLAIQKNGNTGNPTWDVRVLREI